MMWRTARHRTSTISTFPGTLGRSRTIVCAGGIEPSRSGLETNRPHVSGSGPAGRPSHRASSRAKSTPVEALRLGRLLWPARLAEPEAPRRSLRPDPPRDGEAPVRQPARILSRGTVRCPKQNEKCSGRWVIEREKTNGKSGAAHPHMKTTKTNNWREHCSP